MCGSQCRSIRRSGPVSGLLILLLAGLECATSLQMATGAEPELRPNILWITSEDHGPHLGSYGDGYATTPNIDRLAAKGLRYRHAWSCAPVCAPARTTLISGLYASSTGAEHMRSMVAYPQGMKMFPQLLREAGYYCVNNAKEDYNLAKPGPVWDVSSRRAHWRDRKPGQPFFAVFNSEQSHESKLRVRPHIAVHDPDKVRVPAYHPDTPEVRTDWAQYHDVVTLADEDAGERLREIEEAGLAAETIVFYFADHGPGMPRNKRTALDSGLHVPLVVFIPEKFAQLRPPEYVAGGASDRLVSFVDFAPTVLSLAGIKPPSWMQGHAFLGRFLSPLQPFVYGFRGRMDERYDLVRSVTDGRYVYVRNFLPHRIPGQHVDFMFQTPTTKVWKELHDKGRLNAAQEIFWNRKPPEELYDLQSDPDEVRNLAGSAAHRETLERFREAQRNLALEVRDVGFFPEGEMHRRSAGAAPYDMGHAMAAAEYRRLFDTADLASSLSREAIPALKASLEDRDPAIREWAALGLLMRGADGVQASRQELFSALKDDSPDVRIVAAEALGTFGSPEEIRVSLDVLVASASLERNDVFTSLAALNALDAFPTLPATVVDSVRQWSPQGNLPDRRYDTYVARLLESLKRK